jgi:hypothetical protein
MRTFYRDEENPYDYVTAETATVFRDEEKQPIPFTIVNPVDAPSENKINWDGSKQTVVGNLDRSQVTGATASDNLKVSSDIEKSTVSITTLAVAKEIRVSYGGTIRVSHEMKSSGIGNFVESQIFVNDIAVGTLRSTASGTYQSYTQDITINSSDRVQLYYRTTSSGIETCYVRNFRIAFDRQVNGDAVIITE